MSLEVVTRTLLSRSYTWLVTGAAGFIGSHLLERLLMLGQQVVALDNFSTGYKENLACVQRNVGEAASANLRVLEGDIRDLACCMAATDGVDFVLHHAALGSVPASVEDPLCAHTVNVDGFLNILEAARQKHVKRVVYASSSAVYGEVTELPITEATPLNPISPYAANKAINETYANAYHRCYGLSCVGLRYFNVFGPRQRADGAYSAVIPAWMQALARNTSMRIDGDGSHTRDFCYVDDVVAANLLAATAEASSVSCDVFNIASGSRTSVLQLADMISALVDNTTGRPNYVYAPDRAGDIAHSQACINKAREILGFEPTVDLPAGLAATWQRYTG